MTSIHLVRQGRLSWALRDNNLEALEYIFDQGRRGAERAAHRARMQYDEAYRNHVTLHREAQAARNEARRQQRQAGKEAA